MVSTTAYETALASLEDCINEIHKAAVAVIDDHWAQVLEAEKKAKTWEDKSQLQLARHLKGNHIQIKWIGIKWYGTKANRRSTKVNISRAAGDLSYSTAKLKEWTRPWELEIVVETERQLTAIRKQAHHTVRAIMALRNAIRASKNLPPETNAPTIGD